MNKLSKGFAAPLVLVIISLIVGISTTFAYFQFKSKPASQSKQATTYESTSTPAPETKSSPATDETAGWKVYSNQDLKLSIKYPENLYALKVEDLVGPGDVSSPQLIITPVDSFNNKKPLAVTYKINITSRDRGGSNIKDPKEMFGQGPLINYAIDQIDKSQIKTITLGGQQAARIDNLPFGQAGVETEIFAIKGDRYFEILVEPHQSSGDSETNKGVVDQILSTFKFL